MNKFLLNNFMKAAWTFCVWLGATCVLAQERVYASGEIDLKPGGDTETQYFAINLENAAMNYAAYQMDIVLPEGLELAYYEGEIGRAHV